MFRKVVFRLLAVFVMALATAGSWAAETHEPVNHRFCFTCHGTDGRSVDGVPPSLAGQNRDYLLKQMQEFRDGKRPATIMHQHAKGYTDEQMALIAGYFSAVTPGRAAAAPAAR